MILGGRVNQEKEVLSILVALFVQILIKQIISWLVALTQMSSRYITQTTPPDSKRSILVLVSKEEF